MHRLEALPSSSANRHSRIRSPRHAGSRSYFRGLEFLESRNLLSAGITISANGKSATYDDVDGDHVTVSVTAGSLDLSNFVTASAGVGDQLQTIDFSSGEFDGANLLVKVVRAGSGDGLANIGYINSSGHDLATVTISGDLGRIDAGDALDFTPGVKLLSVRSIGTLGIDTQEANGSLTSNISGPLLALTVKRDIQNAFISVSGSIGNTTIGGSLIGGNADDSGSIEAGGNIGAVKISGDIVGGLGARSGRILTDGALLSLTVTGSIIGGAGDDSGSVVSEDNMGAVSVGHNIIGGLGNTSGFIDCEGTLLSKVSIGGSLIGGAGGDSGEIFTEGDVGAVTIGHDVVGGAGSFSGLVNSGGRVASVSIGGSLIGGAGSDSGEIFTQDNIGAIKIGHDVKGGSGNDSGEIDSGGDILSLTIGGSLIGGSGNDTGEIAGSGDIGAIKIAGNLIGGSGNDSGEIDNGGDILSLTIGGSLIGGSGNDSGEIDNGGDIGAIKIGHDFVGGSGNDSGEIDNDGDILSLTIGGSFIGGSGSDSGEVDNGGDLGVVRIARDFLGGSGFASGILDPDGAIAGVFIGGSLVGGSGDDSGEIFTSEDIGAVVIGHDFIGGSVAGTASLDASGYIESTDGHILSVTIGGSIRSGVNSGTGSLTLSGSIRAGDNIGSLTVRGSVIGNATNAVIISARGQAVQTATDLALGSFTVGGSVAFTNVLAGYDTDLIPSNDDAQIGAVRITGDWIAANLVAGATNTASGNVLFGDANDAAIGAGDPTILSTISSIAIGGLVLGTPGSVSSADHFGFVAEKIGSLRIGSLNVALDPAAHTDDITLGLTGDFNVHEV